MRKTTAQSRYVKSTLKRITFNLNRNTEPALVEHMENVENMQGYIKKLIIEDMHKKRAE